jgi:hypothetical protein
VLPVGFGLLQVLLQAPLDGLDGPAEVGQVRGGDDFPDEACRVVLGLLLVEANTGVAPAVQRVALPFPLSRLYSFAQLL